MSPACEGEDGKNFGGIGLEVYMDENPVNWHDTLPYIVDYIFGDRSKDFIIAKLADGYKQVCVLDAIYESMAKDTPIFVRY